MVSPNRGQKSPPTAPLTQRASISDGTSMSFEFVNSNDKRQIRSHAMRESWRQRSISSSKKPKTRNIAPRRNTPSPSNELELEVNDNEDATSTLLYPPDAIYVDLRHHITRNNLASNRPPKWSISPASTSLSGLYHSLGQAELDPFNSIQLSPDDQELLYHWVTAYAHQAFGQPVDMTFDSIRDLFIPVDLSQVALVHAVLAHSASHLASLRHNRNDSLQAIEHKMAAIRLVNEALGDPVKATSDENVSAVMRLLTFERYWGSEDAWNLHRNGLAEIIRKRGGTCTLSSDWRLELRIQLIILLPKPRWNDPAYGRSPEPVSSILEGMPGSANNFERPHSDFLNFFEDVRVVTQGNTDRYAALARAIEYLRAPQIAELEETRLKCLFYFAIIFKDAHLSQFNLSWLNDSLEMTEPIWTTSLESLRWLLLQGMGRGPENLESLKHTEELRRVANLLAKYPWRRMEDRLLDIVLDRSLREQDISWRSRTFAGDNRNI